MTDLKPCKCGGKRRVVAVVIDPGVMRYVAVCSQCDLETEPAITPAKAKRAPYASREGDAE